MAKQHYGDLEKVFLCDGDAIAIETDILLEILHNLKKAFPSLRHVGAYVGLAAHCRRVCLSLPPAGWRTYQGISGSRNGDERLLKEVKKGSNYKEMLDAGLQL
jgi:hypothetical protein